MRELTISIQKAANGWLVILPMQFNEPPQIDYNDPRMIKHVVKLYKEEFQKDGLLDELGVYDKVMEEMPTQVPAPAKPESNIYIFATYDEASAFIKKRYDN